MGISLRSQKYLFYNDKKLLLILGEDFRKKNDTRCINLSMYLI